MPLALVTGAARANSIAAGIVRRLRAAGWTVVTSDLAEPEQPAEQLIEHAVVQPVDHTADLSDPQAPEALIDEVHRAHGPISALILSHAHDVESGILDTTAESFDRHVAVNARASLLLIAAFARQVGDDGGAIVALTSDHVTGNLPYGASKGALDRLVISAARELGPRGISANVLNPGPIDTGWMDEETRTGLGDMTPLGRLGRPADVAAFVEFLISEEGRWISGQLLKSDGAFSAAF